MSEIWTPRENQDGPATELPNNHLYPMLYEVIRVRGLKGTWKITGVWKFGQRWSPWTNLPDVAHVPAFYSVRGTSWKQLWRRRIVRQRDVVEILE